MTFLSRLRAVSEASPDSSPLPRSLIVFWARSRNARPASRERALGTSLRWQPFRFTFFSDCSSPLKAPSARVRLLSESLRVFNLIVTKALLGTYCILLLVRSRLVNKRKVLRVSTGTSVRSLSARLRPCKVSSSPRKALAEIFDNFALLICRLLIFSPLKELSAIWETSLLLM